MKTKFILNFVVDMPYPNEVRYPGCSTPEDAIEQELRAFEYDSFHNAAACWLKTFLEKAEDVSLTGEVLEGKDNVDDLNSRLNILVRKIYDTSEEWARFNPELYRKMQDEYAETYAKLVQLKNDK